MAANRIYIQVDFQSQDANKAIDTLNKNIQSIDDSTQKASRGATQGLQKMSVQVEQTTSDVAALAQALAGIGIARVGMEMAKASDDINKTTIAFEGMLGSAEKAHDIMLNLRDVASRSPFAFQDLAEGAQRLKAFGFEAAQIPRVIETISNASAALGGTKEKINSIILAVGQMYTKGIAQGQELFRQLAEQGVKVMPALREAIQKETGKILDDAEIRKLVEKGMISGKAAADAILESMQKEFGSIGAKMMDLPTVQMQKLEDSLIRLGNTIMKVVGPQVVDLAKNLRSIVDGMNQADPATIKWVATLVELAAALLAVAAGIRAVQFAWNAINIVGLVKNTIQWGKAVSGLAQDLPIMFGKAEGPLTALGTRLTAMLPTLTVIGQAVGVIGTFFATWKLSDIIVKQLTDLEQKYGMMSGIQAMMDKGPIPGAGALTRPFTTAATSGVWQRQQAENYRVVEDQIRTANEVMRARARRIVGPFATQGFEEVEKMDIDSVLAQTDMLFDQIQQKLKGNQEKLIKDNQALADHLAEISQQALDRARAQQLGGVAAVRYEMQGLYRELTKGGEGPGSANWAKVQEAEALRVQKIVQDAQMKAYEEGRKLDNQAAQDRINNYSKEAKLQIAIGDTMVQATAEQRARVVILSFQNEVESARKQAKMRKDLADEQEHDEMIASFVRANRDGEAMYDLANIQKKYRDDRVKADMEAAEAIAKHQQDIEKSLIQETTRAWEDALQQRRSNMETVIQSRATMAKAAREATVPQTEAQKIRAAQEAADIEIQAAQDVADYKNQQLADDLRKNIAAAETIDKAIQESAQVTADKKFEMHQAYLDNVASLDEQFREKEAANDIQANDEIQKAKYDQIKQYNQAVIEGQRKTYDSLKSAMGGIFDALTHKTTSFAAAIGNMIKTAALGAIKEIVTSHAAAALTEMFGQGHVGFGGGRRGLLGSEPIFGMGKLLDPNSAAINQPGHLGHLPMVSVGGQLAMPVYNVGVSPMNPNAEHTSAGDVLKAAGATGYGIAMARAASDTNVRVQTTETIKFEGVDGSTVSQQVGSSSVQTYGGGASGGGYGSPVETGGMTNLSQIPGASRIPGIGQTQTGINLLKMFGLGLNPSKLFTGLGGAATAAGLAGLFGAWKLGRGALGLGGKIASPFVGAASGMLAFGGLMAMFPALAAAGPFGLIAAGAIGATVGLMAIFGQRDTDHARALIKQAYGVDIPNKQVLNQVVAIAKSKYGGSISMAVASPEVQELVRLYAATQGMSAAGLPRPMYGVTAAQSGAGGVAIQPVYSNGQQVMSPYTGLTSYQWNQSALYVQLDPQQASDLFAGQVVNVLNSNPSTVAAANAAGVAAGAGRNDQKASLLEPLTLFA